MRGIQTTINRTVNESWRKLKRTGEAKLPLQEELFDPGKHPVQEEERETAVCFTGHRSLPEKALPELTERLDALLEALYSRGFRRFYCGGALGFDTLAAQRVLKLQAARPLTRLILALPCATQTDGWSDWDRREYQRLKYAADEVCLLSSFYYRGCMQVRNRFMVDRSSFCLCYLEKPHRGGTSATVTYALQQDLPVLNLAMSDACDHFLAESAAKPRAD